MSLTVRHRFTSAKVDSTDATLINPSNWNDTHSIINTIYVSSVDYNYAAQTPGGSLIIGSNTITMNPLPAGVAIGGSAYISNGIGTAESVPITGVSGNQIIVTCANTHSGAWTIQSASAGIQEACSTPNTYVMIPNGSYNIYSTIKPSIGCTIDGLGTPAALGPSGAVFLHMQVQGIPMFDIAVAVVSLRHLQLAFGTYPAYTVGGVSASAGSIGIQCAVNGDVNQPLFEDILINNFYNNLVIGNGVRACAINCRRIESYQATQDGIVITGVNSGYMDTILSEACVGNGYTLNNEAAIHWSRIEAFNNGGWGIKINNTAAFQFDSIDSEANYLGEISITTPAFASGIMQNVILQSAGSSPTFGNNTTAPGLLINTGAAGIIISNLAIAGCKGNGLDFRGALTQFNNCFFQGNGSGGVSGNIYDIKVTGSNSQFNTIFVYQGNASYNGPSNVFTSGMYIGPSTGALIVFGASAVGNVFANNLIQTAGSAITYTTGCSLMYAPNEIAGTITGSPYYDSLTSFTLPITPVSVPTALTVSSNTITVSLPIHHVGAGLIKNIGTPVNANPIAVDLIADAAFTTDTTGNIVTPAITATVGKVYRAVYDTVTSKWYLTN